MGRLCKVKMNARWQANAAALGARVDVTSLRETRIIRLESMANAVECERKAYWFRGAQGGGRAETHKHVLTHALTGARDMLDAAMEKSTALIDDTIALERRLARRPQWARSDDGVFADAGLVATGDDSPCYDLQRAELRDTAAAGEPVNVVISTDSSDPSPAALAAFIATVRLVQQFRPVNVYWQGAWLADDQRPAGYVFLAPLIQNDMDFSRVAYVLADPTRDALSFSVLHTYAIERDKMKITGMGRHAERAYMPGAVFVDKGGIRPDPEQIAATACHWLGWPSPWALQYRQEENTTAALQEIRAPYVPRVETAAERQAYAERAERWEREQKTADKAKAAERLAAVED